MEAAQAIFMGLFDLIKSALPFIAILGAAFLVSKVGLEAIKSFFTGGIWGPIALVAVVAIIAIAVAVIYKPTSVSTLADFSFGIGRERMVLDTNLYADIIAPENDPSLWPNPVARQAAVVVQETYETGIKKQDVAQAAASAEEACHYSKGDPRRAIWDKSGEDPCAKSLSAGMQAVKHTIQQVDWEKTNTEARKPFIVTSSLTTSTGVAGLGAILLSLLTLGLFVKLTFR